MQSIGTTLRKGVNATSTRLSVRPLAATPTSHRPVWDAQRHASFKSPLKWLREALQPVVREKNTEKEIEAARQEAAEQGQLNVFESLPVAETPEEGKFALTKAPKKIWTEHKYSTANFKMSHRKLNKLSRQIAGKPIDSAILQMMFSEKRVSKRIKSMLVVAKDHATGLKGLDQQKLVVAETWVTKGPHVHKRIDVKGRGRYGIRQHPDSRLHVVLKEGKTRAELLEEERKRKLKRIVSAGLVREDVPLRNPGPAWAW